MMTVHEVSRLTGVSIRALQYYDRIGLLPPAGHTEAGYRLYDAAALETLQQILLFRELEFPLKDIRRIIGSQDFDRQKALEQQIALLTMKKERLEGLIALARGIRDGKENDRMEFDAFDNGRIEEYAARARASWGATPEYREYEERSRDRSAADNADLGRRMMKIFTEFGAVRTGDPASPAAQALVRKLQAFISEHFYTCSDAVLLGLGKMYAAGGDYTENIDRHGGQGTADFVSRAIEACCGRPSGR